MLILKIFIWSLHLQKHAAICSLLLMAASHAATSCLIHVHHPECTMQYHRNVKLALVLLREAKRGQDSPWQLWIESLPHEVATLMHWSDKELQQLQLDSTPTEKEFYDQVYRSHAGPCKLRLHPLPSPPLLLCCNDLCFRSMEHCQLDTCNALN